MEYGLIGMPLGHSHSPFVHTALGYTDSYVLMPVEDKRLADFFAKKDFKGINVTIPHKRAVCEFLDETDDSVEECGGAVNTIVNRNGRLTGYNTDIDGMDYAVRAAGMSLYGKRVIILGTGGTSRTARALCRRYNADFTVVGRTSEVNYDNVYELNKTQIVINATPVGMFPNNGSRPLDISRFPLLEGVFDAVYNPLRTRLVQDAEHKCLTVAGGTLMLVAQARRAAEIFTGTKFSDETVDEINDRLVKKLSDIILIGMPGSGKTTVGKMLSEMTGREFYDLDKVIEAREQTDIPTIFAERGEEYFRRAETEALSTLTKKQGIIIATGGGAVKSEENFRLMRENGVIVRLNRDLDKLPLDGRPLSKDLSALKKLAAERERYYSRANYAVDNDGVKQAAEDILRIIGI